MRTLQINYDDQPNDVVDKVNELLEEHGLRFEDDDKYHDGFIIYRLVEDTE